MKISKLWAQKVHLIRINLIIIQEGLVSRWQCLLIKKRADLKNLMTKRVQRQFRIKNQ
nr:MAG TPA: hypothetical protein [Caudoviricetes sp.]